MKRIMQIIAMTPLFMLSCATLFQDPALQEALVRGVTSGVVEYLDSRGGGGRK